MLTFGNRSLITTSVAPFTVRCSVALLSFFVHEIIKRDKYLGKHFDCEEFAERSETTSA